MSRHDELMDLLGRLRDGDLGDEQMARLEELLKADPAARREYIDYIFLCNALRDRAGEAEPDNVDDIDAVPAPLPLPDRRRRPAWLGWATAAAFVIGGLLAWMLNVQIELDSRREPTGGPEGVAVIRRAVDAQWASASNIELGAPLQPGKLVLERGLVQIDFYSGAAVILEGPAELQLISAREAAIQRGSLRAHVPPQAHGFTLTTPSGKVVDLGTEFGLRLGDSGEAEVHVFDGKVELHAPGAASAREVTQGAAVRLADGAMSSIAPDARAFVDPTRLEAMSGEDVQQRRLRWQRYSAELRRDPALVVYYTFDGPSGWGQGVANLAGGSDVPDGAVVGAQWVTGRWPGKSALEFKRVSDRVRLIVPGEMDSMTLAAWVRIDGFDRWLSSLMLTDGWDPGEPHWQFSEHGEMLLGVRGPAGGTNYYSPKVLSRSDLGRWVHLATVFDAAAGAVTHYVDGQPVSTEPIKQQTKLRIGTAELGNWGLTTDKKNRSAIRNLNGRMDEFAIFSRPLKPAEIAAMHEAGRPN